ncbi:cytosolic protein [Candidatus Fermentibacteria bacterium]|nr:cytosolic protein [Candidatus Fermentibacteria bacterium]
MPECTRQKNASACNCTYEPCARKGECCRCIAYHLRNRELPACCFDKASERTFDRSFEHFSRLVAEGRL